MEKPQKQNIPIYILLAKYFRDIRQSFLHFSTRQVERFRDLRLLRFYLSSNIRLVRSRLSLLPTHSALEIEKNVL